MNRKFIAKSNFVLRRVLNTKENIDILKEFIEVILNLEIKEAKLNPYLEKLKSKLPAEENFGIADLRIVTNENEEINIGIQIVDGEHILTKMLLYYAQIHANQLEYDENREIVKTNTINLLDFIINNDMDYHYKMMVREENATNIINNYLEIHVIQLPKFKLSETKDITLKQAWINYLKGENIEKAKEKSGKIKKLDNLLMKYWREEVME